MCTGGQGYTVAGGNSYGNIVWPTTPGSGGGGSHAGAGGAVIILNVGQVRQVSNGTACERNTCEHVAR